MAIDWKYWLKLNTINDWEMVALTLNLNPSDINLDSIEGLNYLFDEIVPKYKSEYQRRMRLLDDHRWEQYDYLGDNYFSTNNSKIKEVFLQRFLLWLKNEDIEWSLPQELKVFSQSLDNSPCSKSKQKINSIVKTNKDGDWFNKDPRDPEPKLDWFVPARYFARQHLRNDKTLLLKREILADKVAASLKAAGVFKRGGKKPFASSTILKALSNINLP